MNVNEGKIAEEYRKLGYVVVGPDGLPDLFCFKPPLKGDFQFVEVKFFRDRLNPKQKQVHAILRKYGIPVKVRRVPKIRESNLLKKYREEVIKGES